MVIVCLLYTSLCSKHWRQQQTKDKALTSWSLHFKVWGGKGQKQTNTYLDSLEKNRVGKMGNGGKWCRQESQMCLWKKSAPGGGTPQRPRGGRLLGSSEVDQRYAGPGKSMWGFWLSLSVRGNIVDVYRQGSDTVWVNTQWSSAAFLGFVLAPWPVSSVHLGKLFFSLCLCFLTCKMEWLWYLQNEIRIRIKIINICKVFWMVLSTFYMVWECLQCK